MRNWLEQIHTLSASLLFTQGHIVATDRAEASPPRRVERKAAPANVIARCTEACRRLVRPRLIQPH